MYLELNLKLKNARKKEVKMRGKDDFDLCLVYLRRKFCLFTAIRAMINKSNSNSNPKNCIYFCLGKKFFFNANFSSNLYCKTKQYFFYENSFALNLI